MNPSPRRWIVAAARLGLAAVVAVALLETVRGFGRGLETDLSAMVETDHEGLERPVAERLARRFAVMIEGPDERSVAGPAEEFSALARSDGTWSAAEEIKRLEPHCAGLMSAATRQRLLEGRFREVADSAVAALVSGVAPAIVSVRLDPFRLATGFLDEALKTGAEGWRFSGGSMEKEHGGRRWRLVAGTADTADAGAVLRRAEEFNAQAARSGSSARVWLAGPPFHSATASGRSRREINFLAVAGVLAALAAGWWLFGSFRFLPPLAMTLVAAFAVGAGTVFAVFGKPHAVTFVFGTSLIGLGVDYVYHFLAAKTVSESGEEAWRRVARPLACSFATTAACFLPLFCSSAVALRQMAVFTVAGLAAVFGVTALFLPRLAGSVRRPVPPQTSPASQSRWFAVFALVTAAVAAAGVFRLRFGNDLSSFYRPDAFLAEGERKLLELCGDGGGRTVVVQGENLQQALEREENAGCAGLSRFIPSLRRQRENAALAAELARREGDRFASVMGIPVKPRASAKDEDLLDPEKVDSPAVRAIVRGMVVRTPGKVAVISPCGAEIPRGEGVSVFEPRKEVQRMFDALGVETFRICSFSLLAVLLASAVLFRRRMLAHLLPVATATVAAMGVAGWCGERFGFFHVLCLFVFAGLGIDYTIFHLGVRRGETDRAVTGSFLTSFAGFGLLAFTSFAVTASMGRTLAAGLLFSYLVSRVAAGPGRRAVRSADGRQWFEMEEQSDGPIRLRILWFIYRIAGTGILKLVLVPVVAFIYPFAVPARRALAQFQSVTGRRWNRFVHLLRFAWSLADKTNVCTFCRRPPRVTVRDDDGWRAFASLVDGGKGAFLISSHVGAVEMLAALGLRGGVPSLPARRPHMHAFQQFDHDAVFTDLLLEHLDRSRITLHSVADIGVGTAVEMQEALSRGDLVLMAGDRVSATNPGATVVRRFLGRECRWPKGVFVFARLMEMPVFAVTCIATGWNSYEAHFTLLGAKLLDDYVAFLEKETLAYPREWNHFHMFFEDVGRQLTKTRENAG